MVLSRKPGEQVYIANHITITVVKSRNRVRIGMVPRQFRFCAELHVS